MNRYVIERDLPGVGSLSGEQLNDTRQTSNTALGATGPGIQWDHSYVTADRIYCVYLAENEGLVREHAKRAGLPCSKISQVHAVVDPMTAALQKA
jgi:hypothetical protein